MSALFKELCLLHLRDPAAQPFRPLQDLLNDPSHQVTWSTLRRVLHIGGLDLRPLERLAAQGRLSADKLEFCGQALEFLKANRQEREASRRHGVYQNIYEIVWTYGFDQDYVVRTPSLYRGQWDSQWRQISSLLRDRLDGKPLDVKTLVGRVRQTEAFVAELRARQAEFFAAPPTEDELLAVAQHYGFPTPMLDYTGSLRVAAWFATSKARGLAPGQSVLGVIHKLRWVAETDDGRGVTESPGISGFSLLEGATIRAGQARFVKPRLSDEDNRIARQHGLFVTGFQPRDLHGITLGSLFFWQEPGEVFEDPSENVTSGYLLPDQSPLARLAEQMWLKLKGESPAPLVRGLGVTTLPQPGIFGSAGFALLGALTDGRSFFKALDAHVSRLEDADYVRGTLGQVFEEYFRLCRLRADVGMVPAGPELSVDPFGLAVSQLARLSGAGETELEAAVRDNVPPRLQGFRAWPGGEAVRLSPANVAERIALACAVFLASWELLQHVDGDAARTVARGAAQAFGQVDDIFGFDFKLP